MQRQRVLFALCLAAWVGCASSRGLREPWVYGLSRHAYGGGARKLDPRFQSTGSSIDTQGQAWVIVLVLAAPFIIDTLVLPVTVPHDLLFVD